MSEPTTNGLLDVSDIDLDLDLNLDISGIDDPSAIIDPTWWLVSNAFRHRKVIRGLFKKLVYLLSSSKKRIVVTGMEGVGKSVLLDFLSEEAYRPNYEPRGRSKSVELGKTLTAYQDRNYSERQSMVFSVIPGQQSIARSDAFNGMINSKERIEGIIHCVSFGFAEVREESARAARIFAGEDTLAKFRRKQIKEEIRDLAEVVDTIRRIPAQIRPRWLIVAVTKCDLFYDLIKNVSIKPDKNLLKHTPQLFYSPHINTPFSEELIKLRNHIGGGIFHWTTRPVCTYLTEFRWNKQRISSQLTPRDRDHFIAGLVTTMEKYCAGEF